MTEGVDVIPDLSAYLIAGRVVSHLPAEVLNETAARTVAQGIEDGVQAERLGFRTAYLSERWNLKEAGAVGARTEAPVRRLREALAEAQRKAGDELADTAFHRVQLMEAATLVPDEWMTSSGAVGSAADCAARLRAYRDAGADEVSTYGSTPAQNAGVIRAWRDALTGASR